MVIAVVLHIVGAGFDGEIHEICLVDRVHRDADFALAIELKCDAARGGDAAAVFRENRADVGGRAVEVVGGHFDDEGDAGGAVAFVGDFLDALAAEFAAAFFDGAFDIVFGHGDGFRIFDGGTESGVGGWVAATGAGGECDFMRALAEDPAFDGVDSGLDVFDLGPLVVTGHGGGEIGMNWGWGGANGGRKSPMRWHGGLQVWGPAHQSARGTTGAD